MAATIVAPRSVIFNTVPLCNTVSMPINEPPKRKLQDTFRAVVLATLQGAPSVSINGVSVSLGSAAAEIVENIWVAPIDKRYQAWMKDLVHEVNRLELDIRHASADFIDLALTATQIAQRTSKKEKRQRLRNVLFNSYSHEDDEDYDNSMILLNLVDLVGSLHLLVLRHIATHSNAYVGSPFMDPSTQSSSDLGWSLSKPSVFGLHFEKIREYFSTLTPKPHSAAETIISTMVSHGLVIVNNPPPGYHWVESHTPRASIPGIFGSTFVFSPVISVTPLGTLFLQYIAKPSS